MLIKILFDNAALKKRYSAGWGVSYLINDTVLFDTGEKSSSLIKNMGNMDVNVSNIKAVIISHNHRDHTGGLWGLLKMREELTVYACPRFSREFKKNVTRLKGRLIVTDKRMKVIKDVVVTGEIEGKYKGRYMPEQALVIRTGKGFTIVTGCSHPGVVKIVKKVKEDFTDDNIYSVFGGFHLKDNSEKEIGSIVNELKALGVKKAGPTHCSGKKAEAIFKNTYGKNFISVKVGGVIEV